MGQVNATRVFLGDEPLWSAACVELNDVQGLWGGRRIYVEGPKRVVVRLVRPGIPDEARPSITLVNAAGDKRVVAKWAGVKNERFDTVYSAMARLETFTTHLEPVSTGPYGFGTYAKPI